MSSKTQTLERNGDPEDEDPEGVDIGKKHKLGHLRVDPQGNVTFKRLPITQLVEALQLGIQYTVGGLQAKAAHDVLYQDFLTVEIIHFPKEGTKTTPAHRFNDFTIRSYAPVAFRHFRELFNIKPDEFLYSICKPLRELKNPGASGSLFYLTSDDEFILKTVQKKEAEFLKCLLPGYYMNVTQNPRTLLPKFFGLYCYQGDNKNIRVTVMNNLIPSHVHMHEKYDLKGSTYKRRANSVERLKDSPTWKDLDFMERHPDGLLLDIETYNALAKTVQRDCRVLESFRIMDYSFLIGVHQVDAFVDSGGDRATANALCTPIEQQTSVQPKRMMYSTPMDTIQVEFDEHNKPDDHLVRTGGIPARTADGQRLLLYVGIIDILQSYQLRKKLEHTFKSVLTDGTQISVTNPSFYSERFQKFLFTTVFKRAPRDNAKKFRTIALIALRESPVKRRSRLSKVVTGSEQEKDIISTPLAIRNNRGGLHTLPTQRRSFEITPLPSNQSDTSSPKTGINDKAFRTNVPLHANHTSSNSSTGTPTTNSHTTAYYSSSSPSTRVSTFIRKSDAEHNKHDSSTTIYSSSHHSDSLYNEPTKRYSARIMTTSFNNRLKTMPSPLYNRKDFTAPPISRNNDDNDEPPRQMLLPIGGGIVGKLASSTTNLSYRTSSAEHSPMHRQYRNPSASGIDDDMIIVSFCACVFFYMTAAEQRTNNLFSHQNGPSSSSTAVPCIASNVGSITEFLFSSSHSTLSSSSDIPSNEIHEESSPASPPPPPPQILIHTSSEQSISMNQPPSINMNQISASESDNEPSTGGNKEKLGHRRVDETGAVTYKRVMVDDLMKSLQIGFNYVLGKHHHPQRQVLIQDFQQIEYQDFPPEGSKSTPIHSYAGFRLKTYAQTAFRFFRNAFGVEPSSFMVSLCANDLRELPNPGASGSIFYITADDAYIIKTVSKKEARFLLSLLPGYYMNLTQNPFTLLPKFFGLFCYQSANKNIRFVIMNNLIPTNVKLHEKYDLKGSIYKRKASEEERKRELPTLKDNDFKSLHLFGLILEPFFFDQLMQTIEDDVRVLRSFDIMDYSLLLAVHNITEEMKSTQKVSLLPPSLVPSPSTSNRTPSLNTHEEIRTTISTDSGIAMSIIPNLPTYIQYNRVIDFIRAQQELSLRTPSIINTEHSYNDNIETASVNTVKPDLSPMLNRNTSQINDNQSINRRNSQSPTNYQDTSSPYHGTNAIIGGDVWYNRQNLSRLAMAGIPAVNKNGDLLLLYVGIIDILQNYRLRKKLEHAFKSTLVTREEISVCNPSHYCDRFVRFISHKIFRKGGPNGNTLLSDSQSNTDRITIHSSRLMNTSSSYRSQTTDDDDNSSITNNKNEAHSIRS